MDKNQKSYLAFWLVNYLLIVCFFVRGPVFTNKLVSLWGIAVCGLLALIQKKLWIDIRELLLAVSFLFYTILTHKNFSWSLDIVLLPIVFALMGKYMTCSFSDEKGTGRIICIMVSTVVIGYTIHGILNSVIFFQNGFQDSGRVWIDVWDKTIVPATQHIIYYLPVMALLFFSVFCLKKNIPLSMVIIFLNIFFLYMSVVTMSRASIVIWVLILVWELILYGILNHRKINWKTFTKRVMPICLLFFGILAVIAWIYMRNITILPSVNWIGRDGGILNNIRFKAQISAVKQILVYPMGGYHMDLAGLGYAHNVWLDLANAAGVIPFVALTGYTILTFFDLFKLLKSAHVLQEIKYMTSGICFALVLYYMIEPALEANILYLIPWIYINGVICGYNRKIAMCK